MTGTPHGHSLAQSTLPEVELKVLLLLLADTDSFKNIDSILSQATTHLGAELFRVSDVLIALYFVDGFLLMVWIFLDINIL